jgi:protein-tyrosine phosphatase
MSPDLTTPDRPADPYRVTVVCLGNICRSPMGEAVLRERIRQAGLSARVAVDSAGTGDWHLGHPADARAMTALNEAGYDLDHVSRQINPGWMAGIDLLLAMDEANYRDVEVMLTMTALSAEDLPTLRMFRSFDPTLTHLPEPHPDLAVPDPYYGEADDYTACLDMIEKAADGIVNGLLVELEQR